MGKIKIINKINQFVQENDKVLDRALNNMVIDIERLAKMQVPISATKKGGNKRGGGGHLKASGFHIKLQSLNWRVVFNKRYARFQEFGGDEKRRVRKYSTPGKKAFYLRDPGRLVAGKATEYIRREIQRVKMRLLG